jgi:hypothetical protein
MENTNTAVNTAIATDPAATRAAAGAMPLILPGPYADAITAFEAGVQMDTPYRKPGGIIEWVEKPIRTLAIFGDSITQQNATLTQLESRGYAVPLRFRLRQRFELARMVSTQHDDGLRYNHGYGAYSPEQLINGTMTDAIGVLPVQPIADLDATDPPAVFVFCGSNPGESVANTAADIISIWDDQKSKGRFVIAAEVLPRSLAQGSTVTANIYAVNAILKPAAAARGIPYVEWALAFADPESPQGYANPAYVVSDGVHPNTLGGIVLSELLEAAISKYIQPIEPTIPGTGESWVSVNPSFDDANANGYADNFTFPTAVITANSIIADAGGNWQRITSNHATTTGQVIRNTTGESSAGWAVGDWVRATCEVRVPAEDIGSWAIKGMQCEVVKTGSSTVFTYDMYQSVSTLLASSDISGKPLNGRFLTPPYQISADATGIFAYIRFWGSGTFEIRNLGVVKVAAP